jgi:hypothetical protein
MQFQEEMEALLERHVLSGLVDAPWVRTDDPGSEDDDGFSPLTVTLARPHSVRPLFLLTSQKGQ